MIEREPKTDRGPIMVLLTKILLLFDDLILLAVAVTIIGIAGVLLFEAIGDLLFYSSTHSIPHIVGELLLVLIILELFRQVFRQLTRRLFTLNPFIFIGFIVSIRGLLLTEMRLAINEIEWKVAAVMLGIHSAVLLVLIACYYAYNRTKPVSWSRDDAPDDSI